MINPKKENSKIEGLKLNRELLYSIGTLIMLIPVLIIMINVFSCSNNNYIDNPEITETIKHTRYSEEKKLKD